MLHLGNNIHKLGFYYSLTLNGKLGFSHFFGT